MPLNIAQLCDQRAERRLVFFRPGHGGHQAHVCRGQGHNDQGGDLVFAGGDRLSWPGSVMAADRKIDQMEKQRGKPHLPDQ